MSKLSVKVVSRKSGDAEWFEGSVSIPGLSTTKLARKSDGNTKFTTRSSVTGSAKTLAKSLGFSDVDFGEQPIKKAAKKTAKAKAKKATKSKTKTATPTSCSM